MSAIGNTFLNIPTFPHLMDIKEIKARFKQEAQKHPEKHYPVTALKELGFSRKQCKACSAFFWSQEPQATCGDAACTGGFSFIGNSPAKKKLSYAETWKVFAKIHRKLGYTPIPRYPVVARWREDTDFVQAGIYIFQPYVVTGEVKPAANPVVEPQLCLRFNDIDNVGITGSHYVCFVMMGEHAFMPPADFKPSQYVQDHLAWLNQGLGLPLKEITIHEDAWGGGGNLGPSMEFFSRGLELSNQVYMHYEVLPDGSTKDLNIKVLDMGQGQERVPWFTQGEVTSYETTFPAVIKRLRKATGVALDRQFMKRFLPYAALLNVDEVADVDAAWQRVAKLTGISAPELREQVQQQAALYSVAEHARALLVAFHDGALPSNVGGGYNLRVIFRRALGLAQRFGWDVSLPDICAWHAAELKKLFPELQQNLGEVAKILEVEKGKYGSTREKAHAMVARITRQQVTDKVLLQLYDSHGIAPELVKEEAAKAGMALEVPENFYARVADLHEKKAQVHATEKQEKLELHGIPETKALYFGDWRAPAQFTAAVLSVQRSLVVLDQTWFYPTSGGQLHDTGTLDGIAVVDVFKQGPHIIHRLEKDAPFTRGSQAVGRIDAKRRQQLAQHHTATHIINAAARTVLGQHANQAGAKKTPEKASIDLTHYAALGDDELFAIEEEANRIVQRAVPVHKSFIPRDEAEKRFGVGIYQGGAAPGNLLRIVDIEGIDVEACGGTHLNSTAEAGLIHIIGSSKIADDLVRIEFAAGDAARSWEASLRERSAAITALVKRLAGIDVAVTPHQLQPAADVFHVAVEQLPGTIEKFLHEVSRAAGAQRRDEAERFAPGPLVSFCAELFAAWKRQQKEHAQLQEQLVREQASKLKERSVQLIDAESSALREIAASFKELLLVNREGQFVFKGSDAKFQGLVERFGAKGGGHGLRQGRVTDPMKVAKEFRF